jgi:hypothetical protein
VRGVTFRKPAFPYTGRLYFPADERRDNCFMDQSLAIRITAPEAELSALSFCDPEPNSLADWVGSLPMANTPDTATQIRQATFEITRLLVDFPLRMDLLESLRPTLHYLCARLDQQASSTNTHGDAIARLAQRLQTNLCSGYKAVILAALPESEDRKVLETISLAIHRAMSDLSRSLLRTLQFYVDPADRLWLELNQLYLLAEKLGVENDVWMDQENHSRPETAIRDAYLRPVLLALSKPNQLRHRQLTMVFNALELWSASVGLTRPDGEALFCIDLDGEQGPRYERMMSDPIEPRCLHTEDLVWELEALNKDVDGNLAVPEQFPIELVGHLADAWGVMRQRAYRRARSSSVMKICVGIRAAHYFLSGAVDFSDQLDRTQASLRQEVNPFLEEEPLVVASTNASEIKDVWDDAFDLRIKIPVNPEIANPERALLSGTGSEKSARRDNRGSFHFYDTTSMDTSPGGYRIRWNEPLPANVQTGEIVAVRDESDPRWCVAVVRWIRQDGEGTSMGVELLSPRAIPLAARVVNKVGGRGDYARVFLLPALEPIGQPATLVTPPLPFTTGQKIKVLRQGIQTTAQLVECTFKTESFNQFTFRMLDGYLENTETEFNMTV